MRTAIIPALAFVLLGAYAAAQDPLPKLPATADELRVPEAPIPGPKLGQPDKALVDDTAASGLKPRLKSPGPKLPIGRNCVVTTVHGREYVGRLLSTGDWFVLQRDQEPRRTWVAAQFVLSVQELEAPEKEEGADVQEPAPRSRPSKKAEE